MTRYIIDNTLTTTLFVDERYLNKLMDVLTCPIKNLSIYLTGDCPYQRALAEKRYNQFQADLEEMKKELNKE